ncbi:hypothetical protein DRH13_00365 [Candidatus Woesebacteria bacterium]|nr:MAG: hypothetical protein DRH13_00365 [Candidatus Woesebacteria bacterium]
MSNRERKRRGVTPKNAEGTRTLPEGVFESALLILRQAFLEETIGGQDDHAYWAEIELKATDMTPKQVCFQYNMIGVKHFELAEMCINHFPEIKTRMALGEMSKKQKQNYIDRVSHHFFELYPVAYQEKALNASS